MGQLTRYLSGLVFFLVSVMLVFLVYWSYFTHQRSRDALWNIVNQCIAHDKMGAGPAPCAYVDEKKGIVVFKDRHGPLQYLLMPDTKVTGIESSLLLDAQTPNYFAQAWQARHFLSEKRGLAVPDTDISLAVNSPYGRSQDQLHIHISCLSPQVKTQLLHKQAVFSENWEELPGGLLGHHYKVKRITAAQLHQKSPFRLLAEGIPEAKQKMGRYGMAMVALPQGDFLLLATERQLLKFNHASAEEIQDHECKVLSPVDAQ